MSGMNNKRNIIIAVTGASGSIYARLLCQRLAQVEEVERIALIVTRNGEEVCRYEDDASWMTTICVLRQPPDRPHSMQW